MSKYKKEYDQTGQPTGKYIPVDVNFLFLDDAKLQVRLAEINAEPRQQRDQKATALEEVDKFTTKIDNLVAEKDEIKLILGIV